MMMRIAPAPILRRAADVTPQPWRNGGGVTRELLAWPPGPDWRLRLSLADIAADGPFSAFAGVQRWFAVVEGAGVVLTLADGQRRLTAASEPLCFDGAEAPDCHLIAGPTRDLNLMLRADADADADADGCLVRAQSGEPWTEPWRWRACFTSGAARWESEDGRTVDLEANSLLCHIGPAPCRLMAADAAAATLLWIGADLDLPETLP